MNISLNPEAPLAQLYRQARALASEETARPGEALTLSETSASAFADLVAQGGRGPSAGASPVDRRRDQVRRAVIAALQHQALMARRAWVQQRGSSADGDPQVKALLVQATTLAEAALNLHREGDAGRNEAEYVRHFLRATSTVAAAPAKKPLPVAPAHAEPQPTVAQPAEAQAAAAQPAIAESTPAPAPAQAAAARVATPPTSPDIVVVGLPAEPLPEKETPRPARERAAIKTASAPRLRPALVGALAVIALIGFAVGVMTAPRFLGNNQRSTKPPQQAAAALPTASPQSTRPPVAAVAPAPSGAPGAAVSPEAAAAVSPSAPQPTVRPTPQRTPPPGPAMVELVFRSEPNRAQVYVNGTLKGTTPLQLEALPGTALAVTVRRGSRVWRGTVRVGQSGIQAITVRLPQPVVAQKPPTAAPTAAPVSPPTAMNRREHFEGLLAQGVDLYRSGWYGPAAARFRQAIIVMPDSPRGYLWLARASFKAGRYQEARRALEKVIAMAPGSESAREAQKLLNLLKHVEKGA